MSTDTSPPRADPQALIARNNLLAGLLLGIVAERLWWGYDPTQLTLLILATVFCVCALWMVWQANSPELPALAFCSAMTLTCLMLTLWRATPLLQPLLLLSALVSATLFLLQRSKQLHNLEPHQTFTTAAEVVAALVMGTVRLIRSAALRMQPGGIEVRRALLGLLIALPLAFVFVRLFMAADAAFARWATSLDWVPTSLLSHLWFVLILGWILGGALTMSWQAPKFTRADWRPVPGKAEITIALSIVSALFVLFAGFQLASLFGSAENNVARSGLSIAEFARHGFFQLLWIAALALGLLGLWCSSHDQRGYRRASVVLLACVTIVLAAAVQRVNYYLAIYGLTVDRVVACAVMLWLGLGIIAFAATVLRQRPGSFLALAAALAIGINVVLAILNPAVLVVRTNAMLAEKNGRELDVSYLLTLEADAVPALINELNNFKVTNACMIASGLLERWSDPARHETPRQQNWRYWRAANATAVSMVAANMPLLQQASQQPACQPRPR